MPSAAKSAAVKTVSVGVPVDAAVVASVAVDPVGAGAAVPLVGLVAAGAPVDGVAASVVVAAPSSSPPLHAARIAAPPASEPPSARRRRRESPGVSVESCTRPGWPTELGDR